MLGTDGRVRAVVDADRGKKLRSREQLDERAYLCLRDYEVNIND